MVDLFKRMPFPTLNSLEKSLGLSFKKKDLLQQALTHSSYAKPRKLRDNERLEFLGDAILSAIIAEALYQKDPMATEGDLTKKRSQCAQGSSLAKTARNVGLEPHLRHGLAKPSPQALENLLEQAFEALVGAFFLDQGFEKTREKFLEWLPLESHNGSSFNPKGTLQELLQPKIPVEQIEYKIKEATGPHHDRLFTVELFIKGKLTARSTARSKKMAEEKAAEEALKRLKQS